MTNENDSLLLMEVVAALGFTKEEIIINKMQPVWSIIGEQTLVGSCSEGLQGGLYMSSWSDNDIMDINRNIHVLSITKMSEKYKEMYEDPDIQAVFLAIDDAKFPGYMILKSLKHVKCLPQETLVMVEGNPHLSSEIYSEHFKMLHSTKPEVFYGTIIKSKTHQFDSPKYSSSESHGPALTKSLSFERLSDPILLDFVPCIVYPEWPSCAQEWLSRKRVKQWPPKNLIRKIEKQGCNLAPVGHFDSEWNTIQWRLSFPGEALLIADLNEVQIACLILLKVIINDGCKHISGNILSTFHAKNVIFWCIEKAYCHWEPDQFTSCLRTCILFLINSIEQRNLPYYFILKRNLFNSKLTPAVFTEIAGTLKRYYENCIDILELETFKAIREETSFDISLLKAAKVRSVVAACFHSCLGETRYFQKRQCFCIDFQNCHDSSKSLLVLKSLQENTLSKKGPIGFLYMNFLRSLFGLIYYSQYKETGNDHNLNKAKDLIGQSTNLQMSSIQIRAASFYLMENRLEKVAEICQSVIENATLLIEENEYVYLFAFVMEVIIETLEAETDIQSLEKIKKSVVVTHSQTIECSHVFEDKIDLITMDIVWLFHNIINIHNYPLCISVFFMAAEKWALPEVIQFELLSLSKHKFNPYYGRFQGISLHPKGVAFLLMFLKDLRMQADGERESSVTNIKAELLEDPDEPKFQWNNIIAYCYIKIKSHALALKCIIDSFLLFPSRYNVSYGYIRCIVGILLDISKHSQVTYQRTDTDNQPYQERQVS